MSIAFKHCVQTKRRTVRILILQGRELKRKEEGEGKKRHTARLSQREIFLFSDAGLPSNSLSFFSFGNRVSGPHGFKISNHCARHKPFKRKLLLTSPRLWTTHTYIYIDTDCSYQFKSIWAAIVKGSAPAVESTQINQQTNNMCTYHRLYTSNGVDNSLF